MTSIDRTAYPRLPANLTRGEIVDRYTPTDDEIAFVQRNARGGTQWLALLLTLKCVQWLGHFPTLAEVPVAIQRYLGDLLELPRALVPTMSALRIVFLLKYLSKLERRQEIRSAFCRDRGKTRVMYYRPPAGDKARSGIDRLSRA